MASNSTTAEGDLWCMHIQGPDDIHAAPDFWTALAWAAELNSFIAEKAAKGNWKADDNYPLSQATVQRWTGTRESHAVQCEIELADRAEHAAKRAALTQSPESGGAAEPVAELAQIRAMLLSDQGDDNGSQILPDFDEGMSVAALVSRCVHLLEQRRDVLDAYKLKSDETGAHRSRLEAEGWSQASVVSCYWISAKPDHELVPVVNLDLRKLYEATHELAASPPPPAEDGETEPSDLGRLSAGADAEDWSSVLGYLKRVAGGDRGTICMYPHEARAILKRLTAVPAAPRKGPSDIEAILRDEIELSTQAWEGDPIKIERIPEAAARIAALFADRGETRGEDWLPIATAPKDGTWVLLRFAPPFHDSTENGIAKGTWVGTGWWLSAIWAASIAHAEPVEWRPLPSPHRAAPDQGGTEGGR